MASNKKTLLKVAGMTCQSCVRHVSQALTSLTGVSEVRVDLPAGKVLVDHDAEMAPEGILVKALADAGYQGNRIDS